MAETSPASRRRSWAVPLGLVLLVALFLFPYVFLGRSLLPLDLIPIFQPWVRHAGELWGRVPPAHNPLLDALQQYYPRRVHMHAALAGGWLPLWEPGVYGGSPFLGAQQGAVLYPPAWLLAPLAPELQFGWSAFLHLSLAAGGGYLFLREIGLGRAAAATGAVAFAFNGFTVVWLAYPNVTQWTLCWLPLAFFCWERGYQRGDLRWTAATGLVLGLNLLGGHAQSSAYVLLTWGAWALLRALTGPARVRSTLQGVGVPLGLALGLALGHLLPALDYVPRTDRAGRISWEAVQGAGMPPAQLLTMLLPRLFGDGTAPFGQQHWLPRDGRAVLAFVERSFYPGVSVLVLAAGALALLRRGPLTAEAPSSAEDRKAKASRGTAADPAKKERRASRPLEHPNTGAPTRATGPSGGGTPEHRTPNTEHPTPTPTHRTLALFSVTLTVLAVLWAMATPLYWPLWRLAPGFGQFTAAARIICLAAWPLACLAALGVSAASESPERGAAALRLMAGAAVVLGLAAGTGHFVFGGAAPEGVQQFLASTGRPSAEALAGRDLALALLWMAAPVGLLFLGRGGACGPRLKPALAGALVTLVVAADLAAFGTPFNPAADPAFARAKTPELEALAGVKEPYRFLSVDPEGGRGDFRQWMPSNLPAARGLADIAGSDSFVSRRYREWEEAMRKAAGGAGPWSRPGMPGLEAAGVRFYLTGRRELFPGLEPFVETAVQEDPGALPYARLHTNVQALPTAAAVLDNLAQPNRFPGIALTTGPGAPSFNGPSAVVPFRLRRRNSNRLKLEGAAPRAGLLVVCEQFDPAWRATVDGRPARIVPADHLLIGVPVEAGEHRVELTYAPQPFRAGLFFTLLAAGLLAGLCTGVRRRSTAPADQLTRRRGGVPTGAPV